MDSLSGSFFTAPTSIFSEPIGTPKKSQTVTSSAKGKENVLRDASNTKHNMTSSHKKLTSSPLKLKRLGKSDDAMRSKRKQNLTSSALKSSLAGAPTRNPVTMAKRNARERRRVQNINKTLDSLEKILPEYYMDKKDKNKKLSKLEVLRATIDYIQTLQVVLNEDNKNNNLFFDLQQFLPPHMQQQMNMQAQFPAHASHAPAAPMPLPHMHAMEAPAHMPYMPPVSDPSAMTSESWGMMTPETMMNPQAPAMSGASAINSAPMFTPQYDVMQQNNQQTPWSVSNIL